MATLEQVMTAMDLVEAEAVRLVRRNNRLQDALRRVLEENQDLRNQVAQLRQRVTELESGR